MHSCMQLFRLAEERLPLGSPRGPWGSPGPRARHGHSRSPLGDAKKTPSSAERPPGVPGFFREDEGDGQRRGGSAGGWGAAQHQDGPGAGADFWVQRDSRAASPTHSPGAASSPMQQQGEKEDGVNAILAHGIGFGSEDVDGRGPLGPLPVARRLDDNLAEAGAYLGAGASEAAGAATSSHSSESSSVSQRGGSPGGRQMDKDAREVTAGSPAKPQLTVITTGLH